MSWITQILTATNSIKDPFVKFLLRLFLVIVLAVVVYLAFALITGKKIVFNNGTYEIVDAKTADSIAAVKDKTVKPQLVTPPAEHRTVVIDTVYQPTPNQTIEPRKPHRKHAEIENNSENETVPTNPQPTTEDVQPNPAELTENDKSNIIRKVTELQSIKSNQQTHISIFYTENDNNGSDCAYHLKSYLVENGYDVNSIKGYPDNWHKDDDGFYIAGFFHPRSGDAIIGIWVGLLKNNNRPCVIVPWKN